MQTIQEKNNPMLNEQLEHQAKAARAQYKYGQISREEAVEMIKPYIDRVNETGKRLAKEHGVTHRPVSITGFLR